MYDKGLTYAFFPPFLQSILIDKSGITMMLPIECPCFPYTSPAARIGTVVMCCDQFLNRGLPMLFIYVVREKM